MIRKIVIIFLVSLIFFSLISCVEFKNITKGDINNCYSNVMSKEEEDILNQLIEIWNKVSEDLGIRWSVCAGSYIGLKRDKKRISWDDDFDVTILKEDLPKFKNIESILSKYNVSITTFWGGYKLFFNDDRGIKKFDKFPWKWPFIDIFAIDKDTYSYDCHFLKKSEFPLKKEKFGDVFVNVYENPEKNRKSIFNTEWKKNIYDSGYRHQLETEIKTKCKPKPL